jgi:3-dehydroquinate synthase
MAATPSSEPRRLEIASRSGTYAVVPAAGLVDALAIATAGGKSWLVIDEAVLALHRDAVARAAASDRIVALPATEEAKSFERLGPVFAALLESGFRRDCTLVAVGGGVIQDIVAFVATVLIRGVRWELIPTTLLAQCDSCIGAKSSINIGRFKNQLGSFYPPERIHLAPALLDSLPEEAMRSGMGEIAKFHLLEGRDAWDAVRSRLGATRPPDLEALIWKSLGIKRRYIEEDEFDRGVRNLLNYGHTFGHAFESATAFGIPHGIAVALGMSAATFISERRGMAPAGHFDEIHAALRPLYAPSAPRLRDAGMESVLAAMRTDKKNVHGATYVILTRGPGRMEKTRVDLAGEIAAPLSEFMRLVSG